MAAQIWSDVSVAVQSALATATTIAGISQATGGGVVTYTGAALATGAYVVLKSVGSMTEVNERVFRVASPATGTFTLEGENTSGYSAFSTTDGGTFQVVTFGTSLNTIRGVSASGGEYEFVDTTTIHDKIRTQVPSVAAPITYSFESRYEPGNSGLTALKTASDTKAQRAVKFTFADGGVCAFYGYVGYVGAPTGSAQDLAVTPVTITASNTTTDYAA